jgi:hypothetical protein
MTYAPPFCTDEVRLRADLRRFFRSLRHRLGQPIPYAWVPERHADGERLHVHCALGRFVLRSMIAAAWPHGLFWITQISDLPVGSTPRDEARVAARYLAKYVGKDIGGRSATGLHRYEVAQGFQPREVAVTARTGWEAFRAACDVVGSSPRTVWWSRDQEGWEGPPSVWVQWA